MLGAKVVIYRLGWRREISGKLCQGSLASTDKDCIHPHLNFALDDPQDFVGGIKGPSAVPTVKSALSCWSMLYSASSKAPLLVFTAYAGGAFFTDSPALKHPLRHHRFPHNDFDR